LQNQSILYRKGKDGKEKVFLDPNGFSKDGTTSLSSVRFNKKGNLVAYMISEGGSDWGKIIIIDAATKKQLGAIENVKFSGIAWKGNDGFYYSTYDKPEEACFRQKQTSTNCTSISLHTQKEDMVIFGNDQKNRYVSGYLTEDERYLIISAANSTYGNKLYVKDLSVADGKIVTIVDNYDSSSQVLDNKGATLYISTDYKAPNNRLVTVDANAPQQSNWKDLIAETDNVLSVTDGGGYLFAFYMKDAVSQVKQLDYNGKLVREITLPGLGTASGFGGKKGEKTLYYSFTNYTTPGNIYAFDPKTRKICGVPKA
jgi:prolyl oligopeptidase